MVAPDYIVQFASCDEGLDIAAIQAKAPIDIKSIASAGYRAVGIDEAGVGGLIQHRADDMAGRLASQGCHATANGLQAFGRERSQALTQ